MSDEPDTTPEGEKSVPTAASEAVADPTPIPVEPLVDERLDPPTAPEAPVAPLPPAPAPVAAAVAPAPPSSHLMVPKWLVLVLAALVIAGAGFAVGWIAAPGDSGSPNASRPFGGNLNPFGNGNRSNGNAPNGNAPNPNNNGGSAQSSGAFLGVAVQIGAGSGAEVAQVESGSPAATAGIVAGDVITKFGATTVTNPTQLRRAIGTHSPGDKVAVTFTHAGSSKTATVTLVDRSGQNQGVPVPVPSPGAGSNGPGA